MWNIGTEFPWDTALPNELQFNVRSIQDYMFQFSKFNVLVQVEPTWTEIFLSELISCGIY